jgi:hypothetical protein
VYGENILPPKLQDGCPSPENNGTASVHVRRKAFGRRWIVPEPYGVVAGGDGEDASCESVWRIGVEYVGSYANFGLPIREKLTFCKRG